MEAIYIDLYNSTTIHVTQSHDGRWKVFVYDQLLDRSSTYRGSAFELGPVLGGWLNNPSYDFSRS